ncbi:glucans biosynthesis glucosyltransferase MdoH [Stenotrophobium rhamnosiphilum]|uniref:Glucans biosynthesis glucosyltransferase H n=1 Tax=Stenotrophobium rhamnosiphilum TaxID=2029166 RepID=A0A2T5MJI7_9GAMM|nr:glucans biosynthesis glucosyltransferase MdoH [Stenotrophobium rhamnosiphilum]PTU32743.1 glucans biosynthesis glucosyltransferase MdoH [Stenotrophobium rhamnosiphilum]
MTTAGDSNIEREALLARLQAQGRKRGDAHISNVLPTDVNGHLRLVTMPPLHRASMTPNEWQNNPFKRFASWLRLRYGKQTVRAPEVIAAEAPHSGNVPWRVSGRNRRFLLLGLVIAQTWVATFFMSAVLPYHGTKPLELVVLAIYAILFAWVGSGFWTALMGFWVLLRGKDKYSINGNTPADQPIADDSRTAIIIPICNEDVARVFAGLRASYDSVMRAGALKHFDFFIISDSSEADTRVAELEAWMNLCREVDGFSHIHYRLRRHRIKRKSGNVADWCRRWGSDYKYMVVFDADSVMSGSCLKRLVQLMEANPGAGIIQTAPRASGRETLYARIQQFATRAYGPLFTAGLHYWQLGESHYWGHNAILRVAPFMQHCSLGRLSGSGALSGEILSHDFVEAALMRRAGWSVWIAYDLEGSYEEMPPTLLDELKRDRRWCQGNLQNFRLFFSQGLHPAHRAVFMTGVMAYLSAPMWFIFLVLSTVLLAVQTLTPPEYFTQPYQLFPTWPEWHPEWAMRLFGATATLLFLPKLLSLILLLAKGSRFFGGPFKLIGTTIMEVLFSALLAPVRMLFHTQFVTTALIGWSIKWKSPPRGDNETPWSEALLRHGTGTLLGIVWAGIVYWLNPGFLWWLLPIVGSLIIAVPLSVWSSRVSLGRWSREHRFFLIPEESNPPRELRWTKAAVRRAPDYSGGFERAAAHPLTFSMVRAAVTPRDKRPPHIVEARAQLALHAFKNGPNALNETQRNTLLADPDALSRLHHMLQSDPVARHSDWPLEPAPK